MNWKQASHIENRNFELPGDWLKIEYYEALNILFRIENSLRVFVFIILKNELKDNWSEQSITSDDQQTSTISAFARRRLAQDKNYAYLGFVLNSPLLHLTSGELIRIITHDSYWKYFKNYFPGSRDIMKLKLDEIGNVRNSLAHFRPIKSGDIELIKQNSIHTLSIIEKTLQDFINCPDIVPTNTEAKWYTELRTLGTEECTVSFKQSKSEEWVKLILCFNSPIFTFRKSYLGGFSITACNLKTDNILKEFLKLTQNTICVTEKLPSIWTKEPPISPIIEKEIQFTFSKNCINSQYALIKSEIEKILIQISKELALIKEDNLARGKLIEIVNTRLKKDSETEYLDLHDDPFVTELDEETPVEFFGRLNYTGRNFVTHTEIYPWMPVDISNSSLF